MNISAEKFRAENSENSGIKLTSLPSLEQSGRPAKRKRESEPNEVNKKSRERGLVSIRPDEQGEIIRMSQRGIQKT